MTSISTIELLRSATREAADESGAFATLTLIGERHRGERFCLELLSPLQYKQLADEVQRRTRADAAQGLSTPPLNERALVAVVVLDIDDESPTEEAVLFEAAAVRSVFSVHLSIETAAYVAMRITASGARKYHVYFPHVVNTDRALLDVAIKLARVRTPLDRKPSTLRHLRFHGTDRRDVDTGQFTGAGIYRLLGGYTVRGIPLRANSEPDDVDYCWHSVRAGESVVRRLLLDPDNACPRAATRVAAHAMAQVQPRADPISCEYVAAAAGGEEAREVQLLLTDCEAKWFVVSSRLPCATCGDERTERRTLGRLAPYIDGAGDQWMAIYRWALCVDCHESTAVQSLTPPLIVPLAPGGAAAQCKPPRTLADDLSFASHDNILNLPIEFVYPRGFGDVAAAAHGQANLGVRRVSAEKARAATTVTTLAHQLQQLAPADSPQLTRDAVVETSVHLSAAECTTTDAVTGETRTRLWTGLEAHPPPPLPADAHGIDLWETQCGGGKTVAAIKHELQLLAPGERLLVVAPRVALCCQLQERAVYIIEQTDASHAWLGHVHSYKGLGAEAAKQAHVIVTTLESLPRFTDQLQFAGVIVDEFCTVVHTLHGKTTQSRRLAVLDALVRTLARARHTILMDRDMGAGERLFVALVAVEMQRMRWPRTNVIDAVVRAPAVHVRHIGMEDSVQRTIELWDCANQMRAHMQQQLLADKNIAIFCAVKKDAQTTIEHFAALFGAECITLITGDTDEDAKRQFALKPDRHFGDRATRIWIYTTAASVGLSVDELRFHEVYAMGDAHLSLRDLMQAEARVRLIIGQQRNERRIHLCLPKTVADRTGSLHSSMPTIGDVLAEHAYAMRHTQAVGVALAPQEQSSPSPLLPVGDIDCDQLYRPRAVVLLALAAFENYERQLTRTVLTHWCHDANVTVIEHAAPADAARDVQVVGVAAARRVGAVRAAAKRKVRQALGEDAEQQKRARGDDSFAPPHLELAAACNADFAAWSSKRAAVHVRVWLASLVSNPSLLSQTLLASQRRAGGAAAAVEPYTGVALLGKLALHFLGLSCVLRGEYARPSASWRIDEQCGPAPSPHDGRTPLTLDAFFSRVASHPLIGKTSDAMLPSAGLSEHFKGLEQQRERFRKKQLPNDRLKLLVAIVNHCYGNVEQPQRYIWSLAHWLAQNDELENHKERLFDQPTRALLDEVVVTDPWNLEN
jgi:hypothetical protein